MRTTGMQPNPTPPCLNKVVHHTHWTTRMTSLTTPPNSHQAAVARISSRLRGRLFSQGPLRVSTRPYTSLHLSTRFTEYSLYRGTPKPIRSRRRNPYLLNRSSRLRTCFRIHFLPPRVNQNTGTSQFHDKHPYSTHHHVLDATFETTFQHTPSTSI